MSYWEQFQPASLVFCENLLGGWIRQPSNTFSNLGFIIVGIILWKRTPIEKNYLRIFSIGSILVGLTSMVFHATMTYEAQYFDESSMFLTVGMLDVMNAMRLGWLKRKAVYIALAILQIATMLLMFLVQKNTGEVIFAVLVFFVVISEIVLHVRNKLTFRQYKWWAAALTGWLTATLFWVMDIKRVWCDPDNHWLQGHAIWHILGAVVVYFLYRFYEEAVTETI